MSVFSKLRPEEAEDDGREKIGVVEIKGRI
jgi:hypothetical protein